MPTQTPPNSLTALQPGTKLDKYELRQQIGAGGMAVVYKGYDALMDRFVAIKQVNLDLASENGDEGALERFRQEARLQKRAAVQSKHLVSFIDFIEESRGLFIIQEYVDGVSLEQVLTTRPQPMEARQALGIIGATTIALQAIHAKKIIHRDLKPSNILLPHEGGLKVCDFGLAATISEQESLPLGSVRYMAPEMFKGEGVDGRADIYALGMIAYEMLLGRAAFNEAFKVVLRDQRNQSLRWMKWHTNLRVRAVPMNEINPSISDTLSDLVSRMMEKDLQARIQSADELLDTIRRHFTPGASPDKRIVDDTRDVAAQAPQVSPAAATAKLPNASRLPFVLVALLVFNVLAGLGLWAYFANQKASAIKAQRADAQQVLEDARDMFRTASYDEALARFTRVNEAYPDDPEFGRTSRTGILLSQAMIDIREGRYLEGVAKLDEADALGEIKDRDRLYSEPRRQALEDYAFSRAVTDIRGLIESGQLTEARMQLTKQLNQNHAESKLRVLEQLAASISQSVNEADIASLYDRAQQQIAAGRRDSAMNILAEGARKYPGSRLEQLLVRLRGEADYDADIADAVAAEARGEWDAAAKKYKSAIDRRTDDTGEDQRLEARIRTLNARAAMQRAVALFNAGDMEGAAVAIQIVLANEPDNDEAKRLLSRIDTADEKDALVRAADEKLAMRDYESAILILTNALKLGPDASLANKLLNARLQLHLDKGLALMQQRKLAEASAALREAESLAPSDPSVQSAMNMLGSWNEYQALIDEGDRALGEGRHGEAIALYRKADKLARERGLPQPTLEEVAQRRDQAEYESLLAQARFEVEAKRWQAARAILHTLMNTPNGNTPEVQALMAEVIRGDPNQPQ